MRRSDENSYGDLIRRHRKANGLTQREVAARVAMRMGMRLDQRYWTQLETGRTKRPSRELLEVIADELGIQTDLLLATAGHLIEVASASQSVHDMRAAHLLRAPRVVKVYAAINAGEEDWDVVERISEEEAQGSRDIKGYYVFGSCMLPDVVPGDVVIVACDLPPIHGQMFAVSIDGHLYVKWYVVGGAETLLVANDGQKLPSDRAVAVGRVLKISRRARHLSPSAIQDLLSQSLSDAS